MMTNSDNMITQQSTSNVIIKTNKLFHSWAMSKQRKKTKITINNGDGETTPLQWEKKTRRDSMTRSNNEE